MVVVVVVKINHTLKVKELRGVVVDVREGRRVQGSGYIKSRPMLMA